MITHLAPRHMALSGISMIQFSEKSSCDDYGMAVASGDDDVANRMLST
jgi:hypothetical protein